jgi:hypothetical protein
MLWLPLFGSAALESKCHYRVVALGEAAKFLDIQREGRYVLDIWPFSDKNRPYIVSG